ncbi:MAG: Uma2 family endonuclease [Cyanobacteria bacterium J06631_9]
MTYTLPRYASYESYLNAEELSSEGNYRLLDTGELIEVPLEDDLNAAIISVLFAAIIMAKGAGFAKFIRPGNKEMQVCPVGDKCVNRKPDLLVIKQVHRDHAKQAILLGMPAPDFIAEVVSPGSESSENYKRDYIWKREQYEWWKIPEYWIIDPHRDKVTVLNLVDGRYQETVFTGMQLINSVTYPNLQITAEALLNGDID